MALLGASVFQYVTKQRVSSVGTGEQDGWTQLLRLPGASLPGGTGEFAFVAWGVLGNPVPFGLPPTNSIMMEVALGTQSTRFADARASHIFDDGILRTNNTRGRPFFICRNYRTGGGLPLFRGTWNAANDVVLWGRLYGNGTSQVGGTFDVTGLGIMAFSVARIGSSNCYSYVHSGPPSTPNNLQAQGFKNHNIAVTSGVFGAEEWLVFGSVNYSPFESAPLSAPFYQITHSTDGSAGAQVGLIGLQRMGMRAVKNTRTAQHRETHSVGGWRKFTSNANSEIGVRGYDQHANAANVSDYNSCDAFAIKTSVLAPWFSSVQLDNAGAGLDTIYNDWGLSPLYEPIEPSIPYFSQMVVLGNSMFDTALMPSSSSRSYAMQLGSEVLPLVLGQTLWPVHADQREGVHSHIGAALVLPTGISQFRFYALGSPNEAAVRRWDGIDFCAVAFSWDPAVVYTPSGPATPPNVVVIPGKEAPDTSSLVDLPYNPEASYEETPEAVRERFEADDGTVITWPRFLAPRRRFGLVWSGLSLTQRDTLLAFFLAQGVRAFRWFPPHLGATAVPMVLVSDPIAEDTGNSSFTVRISALELVYVGV